jgi:hypothetical protein
LSSLTTGMLKSQIDEYTTANMPLLRKVATDFVARRKKNYDPDILVSEAYLHVIKCMDEIESIGQLQSFYISKISMECTMQKSATNYLLQDRCAPLIGIEREHTDNIDEKLLIEERFKILEQYEKNLKDPIKKIIFEAYYHKGYKTVRSFARYFNFSNATANAIINEMKLEIRNYGKET